MKRASLLVLLSLLFAQPALGLTADELVLIVNGNVPVSVKTAEYYAKARLVPDGRIIKLDLAASENIHFWQYEQDVVPTIRKFLRDNGLEQKVKCAVTFFGTPIRINARQLAPDEEAEAQQLKGELAATAAKVLPFVREAEKLAAELDPGFAPRVGQDASDLSGRANHALVSIARSLPPADDPRHKELLPALVRLTHQFGGDAQIAGKLSDAEIIAMLPPEQAGKWPARRAEIDKVNKEVEQLHDQRFDPNARKRLRAIMQADFGLFGHLDVIQAHLEYLTTDGTVSSFDNELALLWWKYYNRTKWQMNPLNVRYSGPHPPVLMVSRLDGPQEGTATQIILGSLKAEKEGLKGRFVIDSMGGLQPDGRPDKEGGYRQFDQKLLNLANLIATQTKMPLTLDKRHPVLPPNSVKDVALYTGWYSVQKYVPAFQFNAGAVGYHIASFEMVSLRGPDDHKGWVAGLLDDGIAATCGAVAEPYLSAMPSPEEFFPLLLTGKLTLAEVYWKTVPMTSWMMSLVGDPLYTPYKNNPQLRPDQLSPLLQKAFEPEPPTPAARAPF